MDNRPIGFLDSGVGGLTVARKVMRQLPHEEIVYIGDSARAPSGPVQRNKSRIYLAVGQFSIDKECENDCFCM